MHLSVHIELLGRELKAYECSVNICCKINCKYDNYLHDSGGPKPCQAPSKLHKSLRKRRTAFNSIERKIESVTHMYAYFRLKR